MTYALPFPKFTWSETIGLCVPLEGKAVIVHTAYPSCVSEIMPSKHQIISQQIHLSKKGPCTSDMAHCV